MRTEKSAREAKAKASHISQMKPEEIEKLIAEEEAKLPKTAAEAFMCAKAHAATSEQIKNQPKLSYVVQDFVVKNMITMITGRPGDGKSMTALGIALKAAQLGKHVWYFDEDNGLGTLWLRQVDKMLETHQNINYFCQAGIKTIDELVEGLQNLDLSGHVFIYDSGTNFLKGGDRNDARDVIPFMTVLKQLRTQGATILLLHHRSKAIESLYSGSGAWVESVDFAFVLTKNIDKNCVIVDPSLKPRDNVVKKQAFKISVDLELQPVELVWAEKTAADEEIETELLDFLQKPRKFLEIRQEMCDNQGYPYNHVLQIIKNGEGKLWQKTKEAKNNTSIFTIL